MPKISNLDEKKRIRSITLRPPSPWSRMSKYFSLLISYKFGCLPNFMIIGSPKCGTTSLYHYLCQHPNILPAITKETYFFNGYYSKNKNWYKMFFPNKFSIMQNEKRKGITLTGEATPSYLSHPLVPKRVFDFIPNCKLIVILRNPIDRAYSHYHNNLRNGVETESFEFAIEHESERINDMSYEINSEKKQEKNDETFIEHLKKLLNFRVQNFQLYSYLSDGIYVRSLKRWMKIFPKEQFLILETSELKKKSNRITNTVFDFLGLSEFNIPDLSIKQKTTRNTMNPDTRKKLKKIFEPHNEELFKFIGKDFHWD
ncbi:MAG: sulfotransferase [Nitrosopumilaceae archaeon]|nr:sulfotransferase domain-containing protein [Nitrosopumilaceae archaeon]NIU01387.1 sulfotransferase domain-containing protein [Nitrosopumilaceae archaeon]NIU87745.1 sulfotransferase [Nitrosopumilaceae archaeon]NIV66122.1 sulfotransferase [Nitrosopumilaceae archaeon]NIX61989.1 sulfotransferase [Nitrosopumilaceae archaeon]